MEKVIEFLKNPKKRALVGAVIFVLIAALCIALPAINRSVHEADAKELLGDKYGKVTVMRKADAPWFDITESGKIYFKFTEYKGDGVVEIPYLFNGIIVSSIADDCFVGAREIKKVIIPESVTSIGGWAFDGCSALEEVVFAEGLKTIGNWAFANCPRIEKITLPNSLEALGRYVFQNCTALNEVTLGEKVSIVRNGVFAGCTSLEKIGVSLKNRKFVSLDGALYDAKGEILYAYPAGKTGEFTAPDAVKEIYLDALRGSLVSKITLGDGVLKVGEYAFADCANLCEAVIGGEVSKLPTGVFSGCKALAALTLPESVSSIGMNAFYGCQSLESLVYGGSAEKWSAAEKLFGNTVLDKIEIIFEK